MHQYREIIRGNGMKSITKAGVAVGSVLLLAACSSGGSGGSSSASGSSDAFSALPAPTRTPTFTPTPTPTPTPYGPVLAGYVDPVGAALGRINPAADLPGFSASLQEAATAANSASSGLGLSDTPTAVGTTKRQLVTALSQLATDLTKLRSDIKSKTFCTTGSAFAQVGLSESLKSIPAALAEMTAAGYTTNFTVPTTPQPQTRTLDNGAFVTKGRLKGSGQLNIDNTAGTSDSVVSLSKSGKAVHSLYVGKGKKASIEGIEDGTYDVFFSDGVDWDPTLKMFTQSCSYTKFDDTLAFETNRKTYSIWSITLTAKVGGNAKTSDVDEENFPQV
ncbi:hypothetical protein ACFCX4_06775 [Kitasatospora sp. NPDC056327]|uniref:hypothetical protein n=1 Tax=Kitasatospora sp. NPDC056327 TaxID=3345785 RepID=UPI0035DD8E11